MPEPESPNSSNRERLLRLIDGGPEIVNEVKEEITPKPEEPVAPAPASEKAPSPKAPAEPPPVKLKTPILDKDILKLLKMLMVAILIFVCLHYVSDIARTLTRENVTPSVPVPESASSVSQDPSGIGLRLVGVDWGEEPVALLEDIGTGKTYFVRRNDRVKGVHVKQIEKNKVMVFAHGQTMELQ